MRHFAICTCAVILAGCSKPKEQPAADAMADSTTAPAPPAAPAPLTLADVAGKWTVRVMPASKDTALATFEMVATGDTTGWAFNFPKRKPVPVRVIAVAGDSLVTEAGPFESVLRKGVQVSTRTVNRLQDGKLVGSTTAHYQTSRPDSVTQLRFEGTRAQ